LEGHEAPPCTGILGLYNEGDRRRWYWPCPKDDCGEYFEPHFGLLVYQTEEEVEGEEEKRNLTYAEIVKTVYMKCPHCGARIEHD
ncbi:phage terminase large subunit family protein, partial [Guyparkeria sp. 1SP6A2]|nr:phage terminase large subunit family protein [Guyparkeria sp. 1SP6A2]